MPPAGQDSDAVDTGQRYARIVEARGVAKRSFRSAADWVGGREIGTLATSHVPPFYRIKRTASCGRTGRWHPVIPGAIPFRGGRRQQVADTLPGRDRLGEAGLLLAKVISRLHRLMAALSKSRR